MSAAATPGTSGGSEIAGKRCTIMYPDIPQIRPWWNEMMVFDFS